MIINLWSTPRTGSVWYSYFLRSLHSNSVLLTEIFNRNHMNMYYSDKGGLKNYHHYEPGFFYKDCRLESGFICVEKVFAERTRTIPEQEEYLISLLANIHPEQILIMHNHVEPMSSQVRNWLMEHPGCQNIFVYRKDKRAQLASYAIAMATRQFAVFDKRLLSNSVVPDIELAPLHGLVERIKVWDSLDKETTIAYEDITFANLPGLPVKQNPDYRLRLSENMLSAIDKIVSDYENS